MASVLETKNYAKINRCCWHIADQRFFVVRKNLAELEKMLKSREEERKQGGILVKVSNARNFTSVQIQVDKIFRKVVEGVTEALIDSVVPGGHEVLLCATDHQGKQDFEAKVVTVTANTTATIKVNLPVS